VSEPTTNEDLFATMPFCRLLGIEGLEHSPQLVRAQLAWSPERCTTGGLMHGGALMALADSAGAVCAFLNLPDGAVGTSTIESKTNFLRGVREGVVTATSRVLHRGRTVIVVETELSQDGDRLVGKVTQTQTVLR
jgi:1,4-dihydroxy-2-naphthoyl-CoA hydrolase